eukprot:CAMPEP_0113709510 /NCGR_PEP_ID=MMETSP0038_2-20120614/29613_1 /TAXON_ID=2898 /ORGANISM="Cryptomonas paramecium" /LENGTH=42 /DNA_ID=CAMNT_0000635407 /DNA_START=228 /DNA_END=356 /DNA_ORIENTATION=+ /assembly_acc=CAM_ASM_000170
MMYRDHVKKRDSDSESEEALSGPPGRAAESLRARRALIVRMG